MRAILLALLCSVCLATGPGCVYKGYHTFAGTRKLVESDAPEVTRVCFTPFVLLFEGLWAPVTTYVDSPGYAEGQDDHVYLSYIGMQTLMAAEIDPAYKIAGSIMIIPIDTAWFLFAGTADTVYVLTMAEPQEESRSQPDPDHGA